MAASQVRRFLILHKELDADDGELTRTRKVRRRTIAERYGALIEALYSDREAIAVDAKITFEDGRTGSFKANLKIARSEEHTSELQSLMRISYAVFCLKKKNTSITHTHIIHNQ